MADVQAAVAQRTAETTRGDVRSCVLANVPDMVRWIGSVLEGRPWPIRDWLTGRFCEHAIRHAADFDPAAHGVQQASDWEMLLHRRDEDCWQERRLPGLLRAAQQAGRYGNSLHQFADNQEMEDQLVGVADWLTWLHSNDPAMVRKLARVSWIQACEASTKWHASLERASSRKPVGDPDAVRTVLDTTQGMRWVVLLTPEAKDYEGYVMGHCVGHDAYDCDVILSLRDARNRPQVTVQCSLASQRIVRQVKGRYNRAVAAEHVHHLRLLLEHLRPREVNGADMQGHYLVDGIPQRLEDVLKPGARIKADVRVDASYAGGCLPDDMTIEGSLQLEGLDWLKRLPPGLKVMGELWIRDCHGLQELRLPMDVYSVRITRCDALAKVSGFLPARPSKKGVVEMKRYFSFTSCPKLAAIDCRSFPGSFSLSELDALERLPDALRIKEDFSCSRCTSLASLPEDLKVGGAFHVTDCPELRLNRALHVSLGGPVCFQQCPDLGEWPSSMNRMTSDLSLFDVGLKGGLPDTLDVGRELNIMRCSWFTALPKALKIGNGINLDQLEHFVEMPSSLKLSGSLAIRDCPNFTCLPNRLDVGTLDVSRCPAISGFPSLMRVRSMLKAKDNAWLTELPVLSKDAIVDVTGCSNLTALKAGIRLQKLFATGTGLQGLPEGFRAMEVEAISMEEFTVPRSARIHNLSLGGESLRVLSGRIVNLTVTACSRLELARRMHRSNTSVSIKGVLDAMLLPQEGRVPNLAVTECKASVELSPGLQVTEFLAIKRNALVSPLPVGMRLPRRQIVIARCPEMVADIAKRLAVVQRPWWRRPFVAPNRYPDLGVMVDDVIMDTPDSGKPARHPGRVRTWLQERKRRAVVARSTTLWTA